MKTGPQTNTGTRVFTAAQTTSMSISGRMDEMWQIQ